MEQDEEELLDLGFEKKTPEKGDPQKEEEREAKIKKRAQRLGVPTKDSSEGSILSRLSRKKETAKTDPEKPQKNSESEAERLQKRQARAEKFNLKRRLSDPSSDTSEPDLKRRKRAERFSQLKSKDDSTVAAALEKRKQRRNKFKPQPADEDVGERKEALLRLGFPHKEKEEGENGKKEV